MADIFGLKWPKERQTRAHTYTHINHIVVSHSSIIYSHINPPSLPPKKEKEKEKERQNANSAPSPQLGVQGCSLVLKKVNPFSFCILICQLYLIVVPTSVKVIVHKHSGNIRGTSQRRRSRPPGNWCESECSQMGWEGAASEGEVWGCGLGGRGRMGCGQTIFLSKKHQRELYMYVRGRVCVVAVG